jgi:hypothetical protein
MVRYLPVITAIGFLLFLTDSNNLYATKCKNYQDEIFQISLKTKPDLKNNALAGDKINLPEIRFLRTMGTDHIALYEENKLLEGHVFILSKEDKPSDNLAERIKEIKAFKEDSFCGNRILNFFGLMPGGEITITRIPLRPGEYVYDNQDWLGNPISVLKETKVVISKDRKMLSLIIPGSHIQIEYEIDPVSVFKF